MSLRTGGDRTIPRRRLGEGCVHSSEGFSAHFARASADWRGGTGAWRVPDDGAESAGAARPRAFCEGNASPAGRLACTCGARRERTHPHGEDEIALVSNADGAGLRRVADL
jgi:hypothetical protein